MSARTKARKRAVDVLYESDLRAVPAHTTLAERQALSALRIDPSEHSTKPPARYTEASLVKELEDREIGRPSTYASIIGTILDRGYVFKKGTALVPSFLAFAVNKLLEDHFGKLVDYEFTARMEDVLDEIAADPAVPPGAKLETFIHLDLTLALGLVSAIGAV